MCGTGWADDPRYADHDARGENQLELDRKIAAWTKARPVAEVLALCEENGVPCGPVNTAKDMLADAQIKAREAIIRVAHPVLGDFPMQGVFPKLSDTPGRVSHPGPALGENTGEILSSLGYDETDQSRLKEKGII